ncbi:hypothetical protein D3C85_939510 [compost metagenome]
MPQAQHAAHVVVLTGHGQQWRGLRLIVRIDDVQIMLGGLEQGPELIADHIGCDLSAAHRPANKGAHKVLGVIEHKLITRLRRDRLERLERIGTALRPVTGQGVDLPVAAIEQALDPSHSRRAQWVGDVGLVHDHPLHRPQAVIHLGTRIVVGAAAVDQVDGLAGRRTRTYPLEEMPLLALLEIQVREEQVLEQPARHQAFAGTRGVEQVFPLHDLQGFPRAGRQPLFIDGRTRGQPALQGLVLLAGQAGHGQGHALFRVLFGIAVEFAGLRTQVGPVQAQNDVFRQLGVGLQGGLVPQFQHARHQPGLAALSIEYRIEVLALPGGLAKRVIVQAGRVRRLAAITGVDRRLARPPCRALATAQIELTGGVVAGMARHAFFREDRLDIAGIGDRRHRSLCCGARADKQHNEADEYAIRHVPGPDHEKTPRFYRSNPGTNMSDIHANPGHALKAHRFAMIPPLRNGLTR